MTYKQAADYLREHPESETSDGVRPTVIRRSSWEEGKIVVVVKGQPRIAFSALNTSTGKHMSPEVKWSIIELQDLAEADWEIISGGDYF